MDIVTSPGGSLRGSCSVPGDKSIAHRWLLLAATASGHSRLVGVPVSLDVRSTAACLSKIVGKARPSLDLFIRRAVSTVEGGGSTWNPQTSTPVSPPLALEGDGRSGLTAPDGPLDCGNSGTSMRLLAGLLAAAPFRIVLIGDPSLSCRPMERVAQPLRAMGADITTEDGHAPVVVGGGDLAGIRFAPAVPSAQVKSAVLLAGLAAEGVTTVCEPVATRDHTERALAALGAPVDVDVAGIHVERYQHDGFDGSVPGDPSSAAFLIAAAALTGSAITITGVGLNPSRLHYLDVMARMGIRTRCTVEETSVGEPIGTIEVAASGGVAPVRVEPSELPSIIDEVPVLAAIAVHAKGDSLFLGASELRVKETDRARAVSEGIRSLGGVAADEGPDLVIGGGGLVGGRVDAAGDHRMAMAFAVAALGATAPCRIAGIEAADVSFPGFAQTLRSLDALIEVV